MADRPNIVLICVDQWRGDCLRGAGHPVVHTPYLDQFALEGCRFDRAYSATPTCIPARAALFTGLSQRHHGRVGYQDGVEWNYPVTVASEFTRHGYQTQAVGKMHVYPERSQMGFQNVILHDGFVHFSRARNPDRGKTDDYVDWLSGRLGRSADYFEHGVNCNSVVARPWDKDEYLHPTNWVVHESINFLRRRDARKPFFLYMSFVRPHPPYDPPGWALDMYRDADMPEVPVGDWIDPAWAKLEPRRPDCFRGRLDAQTHRMARAGYYGHMTHIDHQINRFLESLIDFDAGQNTYVCFVSDHGEMMGDHHLWRKCYPYEGSAHVPFMLRGPAESGVKAGSKTDAVVELRDVMPTLLDCAGLPIPETVDGRSVLPLARGERGELRPYLHGEHLVLEQSMHWLTDGKEKFIWCSGDGREQMFDLRQDPTELHDLAVDAGSARRLSEWRGKLIEELRDRPEGFVKDNTLVAGRPLRAVLPGTNGA